MIAVICVYNNRQAFRDILETSLRSQTAPYELIALDNSGGRYDSAAQALNDGARQIRGACNYIMFVHQDIDLLSATWLADVETMLDSLPDLGIAGVAGKSEKNQPLISNILQGQPPRHEGRKIREPFPAMTVDECCAIIPKSIFDRHPLDEATCDDWHLYIVEYCLQMLSLGLQVYVLPLRLHHVSKGSRNRAYFQSLKKVLRKHRDAFAVVHTTCGSWRTRLPAALQLVMPLFYAATGRLIAWGLVPEWLQWKKRRRLRARSLESDD